MKIKIILSLIFLSLAALAQTESESQDTPLIYEEKPQPDDTESINTKNAEKIQQEAEERLRAPRDHYRVVPYYRYEKPPTLKKILKNGTKLYSTTQSPQHYSGGFKMGPFSPTNLQNSMGTSFQTIYGSTRPLMVSVDWEWQFFKSAGKLGTQLGIGVFTAQGYGRFVHNYTGNSVSDALFTFFAIPISATLLYHMQFWDTQPLIPFAGVGADYFGMIESRDDKDALNKKLKFGGAAAWHWTAGVQFQLDFLDKEVIWQMDHDYGINHIYLTVDAKQVVGLSSTYDFSSMVYEGGILFEF